MFSLGISMYWYIDFILFCVFSTNYLMQFYLFGAVVPTTVLLLVSLSGTVFSSFLFIHHAEGRSKGWYVPNIYLYVIKYRRLNVIDLFRPNIFW